MSKKMFACITAVILGISTAVLARGQTQPQTQTTTTTVTQTVQHPDGSHSVIEYPVGKEVKVTLNPVTITGATGVATILRDDEGTRIKLNLTGLPAEVTSLNLFAVDEMGTVISLGPVAITSGTATFTSTTPATKFMLIASPEANITAYDPNTKIFLRSAVPEGFAVIPHTTAPVGEKVGATTTPGTTPASVYTVPMLNIPAYEKGDDTKLKINFTSALTGARANVFITPRKDGPTEVKMRLHELKEAPSGQVFVLWAVSTDNKFVKLGQVVNATGRNEAEIKSETALSDFGLLLTMENAQAAAVNPVGPSVGIVEIIKP